MKKIDEIVFAQEGDMQLLGARTMEGLNLIVDSRRKRTCWSRSFASSLIKVLHFPKQCVGKEKHPSADFP
jgi:hypothetical protein